MDSITDLVTDEEVATAFENTNFGSALPRGVIADTLLKCAAGYAVGRTARIICEELGLVSPNFPASKNGKSQLSKKGKAYLYLAFTTDRTRSTPE